MANLPYHGELENWRKGMDKDICKHRVVQWLPLLYEQGKSEGVYGLYCKDCGQRVGAGETYLPGTFMPFENYKMERPGQMTA